MKILMLVSLLSAINALAKKQAARRSVEAAQG